MDLMPSHHHADTYLALSCRVAALIKSPRATYEHQAIIRRHPEDRPADWERLLEEIGNAEGVTLTPQPCGAVHIAWYVNRD